MKGVPKYAWLFLIPLAVAVGALIYSIIKQ